jgi:hypothetical protein
VQARLVNGCGSITLPQKTIWAGVPDPDRLTLGSTIAPGSAVLYTGDNILVASLYGEPLSLEQIDSYIWNMDFEYDNFTPSGNAVEVYDVYDIHGTGYANISIKAHNTCGWSGFSSPTVFSIEKKRGLLT